MSKRPLAERYVENERSFFATRQTVGTFWRGVRKSRAQVTRLHNGAAIRKGAGSAGRIIVMPPTKPAV